MPAALDRLQFAPPPPPGMLRALGFAIVAHLLLLLALGWGVHWKREPAMLTAQAELWSALPQEAAPRPAEPPPPPPAPVPAPPPPPVPKAEPPKPEPAPREVDIALEREKEKKAEDKRRQIALERERERDKKRAAEQQKQLEAKRELEERRKQELAKIRAAEDRQKLELAKREKAEKAIEAQRQANLDRIKGLAGATGAPTATGTALRASGPSGSYAGRVAARIKPNIVFTEDIAGNPRAEVEVRTSPDGTIVGQRIVKPSGVRSWDEAVLKAVIKTEMLPRDVDGRVPSSLIIDFRPKD